MALQRKQQRLKGTKTTPSSFRFDETTSKRLKVLAAYYGYKSTQILEELIDAEYDKVAKANSAELKKIEKSIKS